MYKDIQFTKYYHRLILTLFMKYHYNCACSWLSSMGDSNSVLVSLICTNTHWPIRVQSQPTGSLTSPTHTHTHTHTYTHTLSFERLQREKEIKRERNMRSLHVSCCDRV